eukprot:TRINITY_DN18894_c0_g1_i2.p1 TRINITY_DN18894_c0_g1~~TRINITY_DN18894_c0_g1_i2.p1  ORF type:complete len:237 (+),score=73.16 TRINITY_DN18894_c0_g1_i2:97-807(+)
MRAARGFPDGAPARQVDIGVDGATVTRKLDPATLLQSLPRPATLRAKLLLAGPEQCGKSAAARRWGRDGGGGAGAGPPQPHPPHSQGGLQQGDAAATVGVDYYDREIMLEGRPAKVTLWDLSGAQQFFEVRNEFYREAHGVLLCFDLSSKRSLAALAQWEAEIAKFRELAPPTAHACAVVSVLGCKSDLQRAVDDEGRQWAQQRGYAYAECSARAGRGIDEAVLQMVSDLAVRSLI